MPINCLNVLSASLRDDLLAMPGATMPIASGGVGTAPGWDRFGATSTRWAQCGVVGGDGTSASIQYVEADAASVAAFLADHAPDSIAETGVPTEIPGATAYEAQVITMDGTRPVALLVGSDWVLRVDPAPASTLVAAAMPDAEYDTAALTADLPPTQACEAMLPVPMPSLDLMAAHGLESSQGQSASPPGEPEPAPACLQPETGSEPVLWWEDVASEDREHLLDDAAAGVDGMRLQGSTNDGSGAIVALADDTRLVVFDEHLVHVDIPIDGELALQLARHVHAPAWLDVPPVA